MLCFSFETIKMDFSLENGFIDGKTRKNGFFNGKTRRNGLFNAIKFLLFFSTKKITYVPLKHGVLVWGIHTTNHIPFGNKRLVITKNDLFSKSRHFLAQFTKSKPNINQFNMKWRENFNETENFSIRHMDMLDTCLYFLMHSNRFIIILNRFIFI